jgi:hypothetical protein
MILYREGDSGDVSASIPLEKSPLSNLPTKKLDTGHQAIPSQLGLLLQILGTNKCAMKTIWNSRWNLNCGF